MIRNVKKWMAEKMQYVLFFSARNPEYSYFTNRQQTGKDVKGNMLAGKLNYRNTKEFPGYLIHATWKALEEPNQ